MFKRDLMHSCILVQRPDVDTVMAAIVGAAGLPSALAAAEAGKRLLLANKEALVMAGPVFMNAVRQSGAVLLPIDSEHNAIFQSLPAAYSGNPQATGISHIVLASVFAFQVQPGTNWPRSRLRRPG